MHHPHRDGEGHDDLHNEDVAHEHTDVNIRAIILFAVGLIVVAAMVHVLMAGMFWWLEKQARSKDPQLSPLTERAPDMPKTTIDSPYFGHARGGAQLMTNEPVALNKLHRDENKRLLGYGWVEGQPGVAHMPIGEAKKLILERGLPARADGSPDPTLGTHAAAMGEASSGRTIPTPRKSSTAPGAVPGSQTPQQPSQPPASPHGKH